MRVRWHFIGRALPLAERVHLPQPEQMQLGGLLLVPSPGDQVVMITRTTQRMSSENGLY
jgi:hypothetical protein